MLGSDNVLEFIECAKDTSRSLEALLQRTNRSQHQYMVPMIAKLRTGDRFEWLRALDLMSRSCYWADGYLGDGHEESADVYAKLKAISPFADELVVFGPEFDKSSETLRYRSPDLDRIRRRQNEQAQPQKSTTFYAHVLPLPTEVEIVRVPSKE